MKLKTFLIIATVMPTIFGLSLLLVPDMLMTTNGLVVSESAKVFARGVAGLLLGLAIINWYARKDLASPIIRGVLIGNIVVHALGLITDGLAVQNNVITQNPWFGLFVHAFFVVGFGYYLMKPQKS